MLDVPLLAARLTAAVDEAAGLLVRTAFSTIIRDANDYVCMLMDAEGNALCENATAIPAFTGCLPITTAHLLGRWPADQLHPGDAFITNDPWIGTGHLYDVCVLVPIFAEGRCIGFAGSVAHMADIGGVTWGVDSRSIYEEGLRIPLSTLRRGGEPNRELIDLIRSNVRVPNEVLGDITALVNSNDVVAERVTAILKEEKLEDLTEVSEGICRSSEAAMRAVIADIPDGVYRSAVEIDGFNVPLTIGCSIEIRGSDIVVDYSDSSPAQEFAINVPLNNTFAMTAYVLKCLLDPLTARNQGTYRPLKVTAKPGTLLNAIDPAPVNARHLTFLHLASPIMQAMSGAIPENVIAESGSPFIQVVFNGLNARNQPYAHPTFDAPGMGARSHSDGLSATPFPNNTGGAPIEVVERYTGLRYLYKRLVPDSGGPGRYRGGLGSEIAVKVEGDTAVDCSILGDRVRNPASGVLGGGPGAPAMVELNGSSLPSKCRVRLHKGHILTIRNGGGGGYGDPRTRPAEAIARDREQGLVTEKGCLAYAS